MCSKQHARFMIGKRLQVRIQVNTGKKVRQSNYYKIKLILEDFTWQISKL